MNILITGKNGFIGSHLIESLTPFYNIVATSKNDLNLIDQNQVCNFLKENSFDLIINTAVVGGKSVSEDNSSALYENLAMAFNLLKYKHKNTKIFTFTSGYELDKSIGHNTENNTSFLNQYPLDYYGMSKNVISRIHLNNSDIYTFRLFGVYGEYEKNNRFIKKSIINYISNQPITIYQDRYWDFIYTEDIVNTIKYYINNLKDASLEHLIDITTPKKCTFLDAAKIINTLDKHKVEIIINKKEFGNDYIGSSIEFSKINNSFTSLELGIQKIFNHIKNNAC
jgi:nucleoside-diphosphate-sugar epimerase